jgi:hypothetical protein
VKLKSLKYWQKKKRKTYVVKLVSYFYLTDNQGLLSADGNMRK